MVTLSQQLDTTEKNLHQIQQQKKSQDQRLIQQSAEEAGLVKKVEKFNAMSTELTTVKDKLSKQIQLSQHKDEEIKQGEGLIK
jgi:hypothetical protein